MDPQTERVFRSNPLTSLFAMRPWIVLAAAVAVIFRLENLGGEVIALAIGTAVGLGHSLFEYLRVGRNSVVVGQGEVIFRRGRRVLSRSPISNATAVKVEGGGSSLLEWISAAYNSFATVSVSGERSQVEFLAKTRRQVSQLQAQLTAAVEAERR